MSEILQRNTRLTLIPHLSHVSNIVETFYWFSDLMKNREDSSCGSWNLAWDLWNMKWFPADTTMVLPVKNGQQFPLPLVQYTLGYNIGEVMAEFLWIYEKPNRNFPMGVFPRIQPCSSLTSIHFNGICGTVLELLVDSTLTLFTTSFFLKKEKINPSFLLQYVCWGVGEETEKSQFW